MRPTLLAALTTFVFAGLKAQNVAVELEALKVVYSEYENPVNIVVEGYRSEDVLIRTSGGCFHYWKEKQLYLKGLNLGECTLLLGIKRTSDTLWLEPRKYRVRKVPPPHPRLGTLNPGKVSWSAFVSQPQWMYCTHGEFAGIGPSCRVDSFSILYFDHNYAGLLRLTRKGTLGFPPLQELGKVTYMDIYGEYLDTQQVRLEPVLYDIRSYQHDFPEEFPCDKLGLQGHVRSGDSVISFFVSDRAQDIGIVGEPVKTGIWLVKGLRATEWQLASEYDYTKDSLTAETHYYPGGIRRMHCSDSLKTMQYYYPDGRLRCGGGFERTDKHPLYAEEYEKHYFYRSLKVFQVEEDTIPCFQYLKYLPTGEWSSHYPNGKLQARGEFIKAARPEKQFIANPLNLDDPYDLIQLNVSFLVAQRHGTWRFYDKDGKLHYTARYERGQRLN